MRLGLVSPLLSSKLTDCERDPEIYIVTWLILDGFVNDKIPHIREIGLDRSVH